MNVQEQENDELQLEEQARERIKQQYYGKKQLLIYDDRFVNFDPDSKNDIVGGEKLTYDEYIDIQMRSPNDKGSLFICAIYTPISDFYGTIARRSKDKKRICFNRIFFTYMYPDGMTPMPSKIMSGWMGQTLPRLRSVTASASMRKSTAI